MLVVIPTYKERDNLGPMLTRLHAAVPDGATCSSSTTRARTAPASWPTSWPPPTRGSACCTAPARTGSARPTSPGSPGRCDGDYQRRRRDGRRRLARPGGPARAAGARSPTPTWCSARATCPAAGCVNWPAHREWLSRGGNLYSRLALGRADPRHHRRLPGVPPPGARGARPRRGVVAGLLLPGRHGLAGRAGRVPRARGADHVHRARAGRVEDEQRDRGRGVVAGHLLGCRAGAPPLARRTADGPVRA